MRKRGGAMSDVLQSVICIALGIFVVHMMLKESD